MLSAFKQFLNIPFVLLSWLDFAIDQSYSLDSFQKLLRGEPVKKMEEIRLKSQILTWINEIPSFYKVLTFRHSNSLSSMTVTVSFQW